MAKNGALATFGSSERIGDSDIGRKRHCRKRRRRPAQRFSVRPLRVRMPSE
jgi:hypothetical protein